MKKVFHISDYMGNKKGENRAIQIAKGAMPDNIFGLRRLKLYYEIRVVGYDGECFLFGVYFKKSDPKEKLKEVRDAIEAFFKPYKEKDVYMGYVDVTAQKNKITVFLDLGGMEEHELENKAIRGILKALNKVSDIQKVLINEDE